MHAVADGLETAQHHAPARQAHDHPSVRYATPPSTAFLSQQGSEINNWHVAGPAHAPAGNALGAKPYATMGWPDVSQGGAAGEA